MPQIPTVVWHPPPFLETWPASPVLKYHSHLVCFSSYSSHTGLLLVSWSPPSSFLPDGLGIYLEIFPRTVAWLTSSPSCYVITSSCQKNSLDHHLDFPAKQKVYSSNGDWEATIRRKWVGWRNQNGMGKPLPLPGLGELSVTRGDREHSGNTKEDPNRTVCKQSISWLLQHKYPIFLFSTFMTWWSLDAQVSLPSGGLRGNGS